MSRVNHRAIINRTALIISLVAALRNGAEVGESETSSFPRSYSWNQLRTVGLESAWFLQAATKQACLSLSFKPIFRS